uniref:XPG N-terminal domain-containing protein n=1 Tax=viral metagenome TaxID=1070528 RepID=A0A6C0J3H5_9ZZZZ
MGIKYLNRFLKENCSKNSIRKINLNQLESKTIVIDASIYMYKYIAENALIENMYLLISLLLTNNITPLFVFDGKPPPEKYDLLQQRKLQKKTAEDKYNELMTEYKNEELDPDKKMLLFQEMQNLKNQFVRLTENDKNKVKELLDAYGVMYYVSPGEADDICAYMVITGKAWACLSDDMDMFVYGCPRVIRNISLLNKTVLFYDTNNILADLCMSAEHFKQILVLSGTDYNIYEKTDLDTTIELYTKYMKQLVTKKISSNISFYEWIMQTCEYINNLEQLNTVCELFKINHIKELDEISIILKHRNSKELHSIMEKEGFVFA